MNEEHTPGNEQPETLQQQTPKQPPDSQTHIFSDEVASAIHQIAEELKKANDKSRHDFVALSSLAISLFTLAATLLLGTVGTIYLYGKQAQTNLDYSLAHLSIDALPTSSCPGKAALSCLAELQVTNKGPAAATGITVDVFLQKISDPWKSSINDISNFTLSTLPSNRHVPSRTFYDTDPSALSKVNRNNAFELSINSLPPPSKTSSVQINLGLNPHMPLVTRSANVNTTLYVGSQSSQSFNFGLSFPTGSVIEKYFDQLFSIASFEVNVTCQNCTNDPQPLISTTSSLDQSALLPSLNPLNPFNSIWSGSVKLTFEQPKRSKFTSFGDALYLWTEPANPTTPLDSITQAYLGIVTSCNPTAQSGGTPDTCTPNFPTGNGAGI